MKKTVNLNITFVIEVEELEGFSTEQMNNSALVFKDDIISQLQNCLASSGSKYIDLEYWNVEELQ